MPSRRYLLAEFTLIFLLLPLLILVVKERALMLGLMWGGALFAYGALKRHHGYSFRADWNAGAFKDRKVRRMLLRFAICAALLGGLVWVFEPARFLSFPRERPYVWATVMVLYPLLSVIPQELIYRSFFFTRYAPLFPHKQMQALASALAFAYAHIIFGNWVSPTLTFIGGLLFAETYLRRRSLALVCLEHALFGCFIFTIGLGAYFFGGVAWRR